MILLVKFIIYSHDKIVEFTLLPFFRDKKSTNIPFLMKGYINSVNILLDQEHF